MPLGGLEDFSSQRMATLRAKAHLSLEDVAVGAKVTINTARQWETGQFPPSPDKAALLAGTLGARIVDLTTADEDRPTLIALRQWRGLTGEAAAQKAGIPKAALWRAERYVNKPTPATFQALAGAYDLTSDDVFAAWERGRRNKFGTLAE